MKADISVKTEKKKIKKEEAATKVKTENGKHSVSSLVVQCIFIFFLAHK